MLKQETEEIDGLSFTCVQFGAMRGFKLLGRLLKTVGPAVPVLSAANPDSDVSELAPAIAGALRDLDPDQAASLAADVLRGTSVILPGKEGERRVDLDSEAKIDSTFSGRLPTMFRVLAFAVRVNFGDFFGGSAPDAALPPETEAG